MRSCSSRASCRASGVGSASIHTNADRPPTGPVPDRRFPPGAQPALREVHDDAEQPGDEAVARAELCEMEERVEPRLLYHVFGVAASAEDAPREACRALAMQVDQDREGIPVTGEHPLDDRAVVLVHDPRRPIVAEAERMVAPGRKHNQPGGAGARPTLNQFLGEVWVNERG